MARAPTSQGSPVYLRPWPVILLFSAVAVASSSRPSADESYAEASKAYQKLKSDPTARKYRHSWQRVAKKLEAVASNFPDSPRAPEALFNAAQLFSDLSRVSLLDEDVASAASTYAKLIKSRPHHRLADDAALALARIHLERQNRPDQAKRVLSQALRDSPGDMTPDIRALLKQVEGKGGPSIGARAIAAGSSPEVTAAPEPQPVEVAPVDPRANAEASAALKSLGPQSAKEARARLRGLAPVKGSELSVAEQLGLKVRRVVIDPGHGGHDSGAVGRAGVKEKDVALEVSKRLAADLREAGFQVFLTRDDDRFIRLEDRARIANKARGDLFISIHCNSAKNRSFRGVETYTLNTASDSYSIRLAARENSSTERGMSDLRFILADLATKTNTLESQRLASVIQKNLVNDLKASYRDVRDLGTKEALFYVLLGAQMPAILVETSFLSHPEEEKRLGTHKYRQDLARSIADGIQDFLGRKDGWARVEAR